MRAEENYPRKNAPGFRGYENKPRTRAHFRGHPRISAGNRAYEHPPFLSNEVTGSRVVIYDII